jgi:hypothetical protein
MSKTPYEIRLELLKMAQDQLNQKYYQKMDVARYNSEKRNEPLTEIPQFPTNTEILSEAQTLKSFIDNSN